MYFSTNLERDPIQVVEYYKARFQMEFNFRDAKQFTGLTNCQARPKSG
ncbi:MAG: transposase [Saprospiraceae bacterium]|nr:transposase [Saprospiraceae bacterium]